MHFLYLRHLDIDQWPVSIARGWSNCIQGDCCRDVIDVNDRGEIERHQCVGGYCRGEKFLQGWDYRGRDEVEDR